MYSKRQLYALGEPLGDSVTRKKPGGGYVCGGGGGGSSSTSSAQTTTTNTTDKRQVVDNGVGVSSDSSTVTVNVLDQGIVEAALDTVKASDAVSGEGFTKLLGLADKLFTGGVDIIGKTQNSALAQLDAVNSSANDKKGAIDQKTIVVLALAGAAALVLVKRGKS